MPFESGNIPKETLDYLAEKKKAEPHWSLGVLFVVVIIIGIGVVVSNSGYSTSKPHLTSANEVAPTLPYKPDETIAQASSYMAKKEFRLALDELEDLHPADSNRAGVQSMLIKATYEVRLADLKAKRAARIAYVENYERALLGSGMDATVRATGQNADILTTTFVLINRPFVYKIRNDHDLNATWVSLGFKNVLLTNGFNSSWSYKLN